MNRRCSVCKNEKVMEMGDGTAGTHIDPNTNDWCHGSLQQLEPFLEEKNMVQNSIQQPYPNGNMGFPARSGFDR